MHAESLPHGSLRGFRWWRPCWGAREGRKDGTLQRLASARVSQVFAFRKEQRLPHDERRE